MVYKKILYRVWCPGSGASSEFTTANSGNSVAERYSHAALLGL
jgi:hypothetical protein